MTVSILGIRHHGPGSARSVARALRTLKPDAVLVEGPPEAEPLLSLAGSNEMKPPVALLGYAADEPQRAVFYPFARFSPEWQAFRWALAEGVPLRLIDLPLAHALAETNEPVEEGAVEITVRRDPIAWLADAAGHGDAERFWEDVVEHRGEDAFAAIGDAMAALRETEEAKPREREARREAHMRQSIRAALKDGHERIAVVCGAWHAPALADLGPAAPDAAILKGLPKRKVAFTWAPWTYDRLSLRSGYGAGVLSPGWYDHLFTHQGQDVVVRWLTKTARLLREQDVSVSSAHVIEAVRLAEALAALRERPLAGLPEITEATRAVLGAGSDAALALVHEKLVVGQVLGHVPADAPTVPLQADLEREQRRLRLKPEAAVRTLDLDLRKETDRDRSRLLHRMALMGIPWGELGSVQGARGTFHELWQLQWEPELSVRIIASSRYGSTVLEAATAVVHEQAADDVPLGALTSLLESALLADLPGGVDAAVSAFQRRAAVGADTVQLMHALPPLARVLRYGNVRESDAGQVESIVEGVVERVVVGLPLAAANLDDDAAAQLASLIDAFDGAVGLLDRPELREPWREALARLSERAGVHGRVGGRCTRILHDASLLDAAELVRRMSSTLSPGNDPAVAAAWIEGFLGSSGIVLIHDDALLSIVDTWVASVRAETFTNLLPVLRRTFSSFPAGERRQIGERVKRLGGGARPSVSIAGDDELDEERAARVLPVLRLILGGTE